MYKSCLETRSFHCIGDFFLVSSTSTLLIKKGDSVEFPHLLHGPLCMLNSVSYLLGVGVFPSQDPVQPRMPPWIYNETLVPGKKAALSRITIWILNFKC